MPKGNIECHIAQILHDRDTIGWVENAKILPLVIKKGIEMAFCSYQVDF